MTVREAFEKAGYPVPEGFRLTAVFNQLVAVGGTEQWSQEQVIMDRMLFKTFPQCPCGGCFWVIDGQLSVNGAMWLDNLPAIDAYDALPQALRDIVDRYNEGVNPGCASNAPGSPNSTGGAE